MKKDLIQAVLALFVIALGIYMLVNNAWLTPPSVSGVGFILVGLGQWLNYCPICKAICRK